MSFSPFYNNSNSNPHTGSPPGADILDALDVVVFVLARDTTVQFITDAWEHLSGLGRESILGTSLLDYVHPGDQELVSRCLNDSRQLPNCLVSRWLTKDGACLRLEMRVRTNLGVVGERLGFIGILTDVTRQAQAADVRQANHRTVETLINNLPGMVYRGRNNRDWTMEFVSHGAYELTGWEPQDFVNNRRIVFASLIMEEDRQRVWDQVQISLRERRPFELVYRIRTANNSEKWVLERGQGNYSTSGELLSLEGFITDITNDKRSELRHQRNTLYDADTSLPTLQLVLDRIQRAILRSRGDKPVQAAAVLYIYLDRFARIRQQLGVEISDRIAREVGRRFQGTLSPLDSLCRCNEDEFIALLDHAEAAAATASALQNALRTAIVENDVETYMTASIGVVSTDSEFADADDMLRHAAAAMARARDLGGGRTEVAARYSR
jgi:diguanylate cyclase (GGDEF)-like protein/PAS domain S-box-containing protein